MQIERRTCQACLDNYAEMQLILCKDTTFTSFLQMVYRFFCGKSNNSPIFNTFLKTNRL